MKVLAFKQALSSLGLLAMVASSAMVVGACYKPLTVLNKADTSSSSADSSSGSSTPGEVAETAPTAPSVIINGGATVTTSTTAALTLSAVSATHMKISQTAACASTSAEWQVYLPVADWTLETTESVNTVYVKFKNSVGESSCVSAAITHDTTAPTSPAISIAAGAATTNSLSVLVNLSAVGATEMYLTDTADCADGGVWKLYGVVSAWTLLNSGAANTVYAKFRDQAGNESACVSDSIDHDITAPNPVSISIEAGAPVTAVAAVTVGISYADSAQMYVTQVAGCVSGGSWETAAATKAVTLTTLNATATVYAKFRDAAGNVSACVNDTIVHDSTLPTGTSISIDAGAVYSSDPGRAVTLTLAAANATDMYITNTAGCGSGGTWAPYGTSSAWVLGATGSTKVYVKFRSGAGGESACIDDTIIHDISAPTGNSVSIEAGAARVNTTAVTLTMAATGADFMAVTNPLNSGGVLTWEAYATTKAWTLGQTNATATVYAKFKDSAGNLSACVSDTIIHDDLAPAGPATLLINNGAANTASTSVTLSLAATDASNSIEMFISNTGDCSGAPSWEAYVATKAWVLASTNTLNSVSVKYRDSLLNTSGCIVATITHDNAAPTAPTNLADSTVWSSSLTTTPTITWTASTDGGAGVSYYEMSVGTAAGLTNTSGWTSVGNVVSYSIGGLALSNGSTYYVNVRAVDGAGYTSAVATTDGFSVDTSVTPTLTLATPTEGSSIVARAATFSGFCEYGATIAVTYSGVAGLWGAGNSASTTCVSCTVGENAGCGTGVNQYGKYSLTVNFAGAESARQVTLTQTDRAGNVDSTLTRNLTFAPWSRDKYVKPDTISNWTYFGKVVAISGNTMVVGVPSYSGGMGTAYIFIDPNSDGNWSDMTQQARIEATVTGGFDAFGASVAIDGDYIVVGATGEESASTSDDSDNSANMAGAAYVFHRTGVAWAQQGYLKANYPGMGDWFGKSVAISGSRVLVGAPSEASDAAGASNDNIMMSGAAYTFTRSGTTWSFEQHIKASNIGSGDSFGSSVSLSGTRMVIGAPSEQSIYGGDLAGNTDQSDNSGMMVGAAYVFVYGASWTQEAYLKPTTSSNMKYFGETVGISGNYVVVGGTGDSNSTSVDDGTTGSNGSGAAWVFERSGATWPKVAYLKSDSIVDQELFGKSVAISGNLLVVGAPNMSMSPGDTGGSASIFERSVGGTWALQKKITASHGDLGDNFGYAVACTSSAVVVGAPYEDSSSAVTETNNAGNETGAVQVYTLRALQ